MLVHVTWQQSAEEAALRPEVAVPDEVANDDVAGYLEEQTAATVTQWRPLTRRTDPTGPQPFTCPNCGSDRVDEVGYVDYFCRGEVSATSDGISFAPGGEMRYGENYRPLALECAECDTPLRALARDPFERPDPDQLRARLREERQQLAGEEQEHPSRAALDYENEAGMMPHVEELGPVEAYDAGVEAGIELATGAALRAICAKRAYIARNDWRLRLLDYARPVLEDPGARLIILLPSGNVGVASRLYLQSAYKSTRRLMEVACTRQTRVQKETEGNVYVARRYSDGTFAIYTGRDTLLIDEDNTTRAA